MLGALTAGAGAGGATAAGAALGVEAGVPVGDGVAGGVTPAMPGAAFAVVWNPTIKPTKARAVAAPAAVRADAAGWLVIAAVAA